MASRAALSFLERAHFLDLDRMKGWHTFCGNGIQNQNVGGAIDSLGEIYVMPPGYLSAVYSPTLYCMPALHFAKESWNL